MRKPGIVALALLAIPSNAPLAAARARAGNAAGSPCIRGRTSSLSRCRGSTAGDRRADVQRTFYSRNFTEARAAGVPPICCGQPNYAPRLDRDRGAVACEPDRRH
jgi:hypothetical protein